MSRQVISPHSRPVNSHMHVTQKSTLPVLAFLLASLITSAGQAVGTRHFSLQTGEDFEGGDLKGVAVDSAGAVRAGFNLGAIPLTKATTVWDALRTPDASLLLATGNEGALLQLRGQVVTVAGETKALAVTSLATLKSGAVALGTLPDGKIMKFEGGKISDWVTLKDTQHVWDLAFDPKTNSLFAATGPEGKLYRIDAAGKASVYFDAEEQHLMSVAVAKDGTVYAGASDKSKLYAITGPGRARVLQDFGSTEVRAIATGDNGDVFAIANDLKVPRAIPKRPSAGEEASIPSGSSSPASGKGVLYRFDKSGTPEMLLSNDKDYFVSLALDASGTPYVGTGAEGRIYTVDAERNSVLIADSEQRQIGVLLLDGANRFAVASDPAVVLPIRGVGGTDAIWTSKVLDAGLRATFGRLDWESKGSLEFSTRSGGTEKPDTTWSDWSAPLTAPGMVKSPAGRFVQLRARFATDPNAVLKSVELSFVTDNLRAYVTQISVKNRAPGSKSSLEASGSPISASPSANVELNWKVTNPDEDTLRYRLLYQLIGTKDWFDILPPQETLTKDNYTWNTQDLPEGRYRVRVMASDELANPPTKAKQHALESNIILVDNTPPVVERLTVTGRRIQGVATDGVGPISRIEVAVSGTNRWLPFFPTDGIFDQNREAFDLDVASLGTTLPVMLTLRVYDAANNATLRYITLK